MIVKHGIPGYFITDFTLVKVAEEYAKKKNEDLGLSEEAVQKNDTTINVLRKLLLK